MHVLPLTLDLHSTPLSRTVFSDCFCMEHDLKKQEKKPRIMLRSIHPVSRLVKTDVIFYDWQLFKNISSCQSTRKTLCWTLKTTSSRASLKKKGKKITRFAPLLLQKLTFHSKGGAITKSLVCHYIFELRFYLTSSSCRIYQRTECKF